MKYFVNSPYNYKSLKDEYRVFCKKLHPDTGGNAIIFNEMMREYEIVKLSINNNLNHNSSFEYKRNTRTKSESAEKTRYSILFNSIFEYNGCEMNQTLDEYKPIAEKLSELPFVDAYVSYDKITKFIRISMKFNKIIEQLEINKYPKYNDLSYTIDYESDGMYMSTGTVDIIIEKILSTIGENTRRYKIR